MSETVPSTAALTAELPAGAPLHQGRYVIRRVLGRGGFGITYGADDTRQQRPVAVKELFFGAASRYGARVVPAAHEAEMFAAAKARFLREGAVLARFTHPGIVRVYESFEESGTAYLVMELLDGRTLFDVLRARGPLPEREVLDIASRCGDALAVVHAAGVLHRDLNPTNVVLTPEGRVVLIDFGLAREFTADATTPMTRIVTPGYAPPEQYTGTARYGPPTDVYGLAATVYCMLTGRAPLSTGPDGRGGFAAPRTLAPATSKLVSDAVLDGLEANAGHRPQTVASFLARLGLGNLAVAQDPDAVVTPADAAGLRTGAPGGGTRPLLAPNVLPLPPPPAIVPGRAKVAVPALVATAAFGAVMPVVAFLVLALLVLPGVATVGDAIVFVRLRRANDRLRWRHRAALPPYVPMRLLRNVGQVWYTGVPALLVGGVTVAAALVADSVSSTFTLQSWVLRVGGAAAAVMLARPVFRDRVRFRAAVVGDQVVARALDGGRLTSLGLSLWIVVALVAMIGFGLRPDPWPFTGG
jgi:serine/threonine-protein kinase